MSECKVHQSVYSSSREGSGGGRVQSALMGEVPFMICAELQASRGVARSRVQTSPALIIMSLTIYILPRVNNYKAEGDYGSFSAALQTVCTETVCPWITTSADNLLPSSQQPGAALSTSSRTTSLQTRIRDQKPLFFPTVFPTGYI